MEPSGEVKFHSQEDIPFLSILGAKNRFQSIRLPLFVLLTNDQVGTLFRMILKKQNYKFWSIWPEKVRLI
jgi:hypothetical protein